MKKISKYFDPNLIAFLNANTQDEALAELIDIVSKAGYLHDKEAFYRSIYEREKIVSTGIGMGVAIPHAKLAAYDDFFIAVAILSKPIAWNTIDGSPVRIIFMIGGPDDKQTEYLRILSQLTHSLKDEERRKKLLTLNTPAAIIQLFSTI